MNAIDHKGDENNLVHEDYVVKSVSVLKLTGDESFRIKLGSVNMEDGSLVSYQNPTYAKTQKIGDKEAIRGIRTVSDRKPKTK